MKESKSNESFFRIDWHELRAFLAETIKSGVPDTVKKSEHRSRVSNWLKGSKWQGYTENQISEWLAKGYRTEIAHGLSDLVPPIRDKRKLIFSEEGEEFHYDALLSGDDNMFSSYTKRESIPGVTIEASIMFSAGVDAKVINAYIAWICKMAYSLESAGVDCEITLDFPSWELDSKSGVNRRLFHNVIRVKRENEASDFHEWSPMLSPAAFRAFGFIVGAMHAERDGFRLDYGWGRGTPERGDWAVKYLPERRVISLQNPYSSPREFPEEKVTAQFREAIQEMTGKV